MFFLLYLLSDGSIRIRIRAQNDGYGSRRAKNIRIRIHNTGFWKATDQKSRIRRPYKNVTEHCIILSTSNELKHKLMSIL